MLKMKYSAVIFVQVRLFPGLTVLRKEKKNYCLCSLFSRKESLPIDIENCSKIPWEYWRLITDRNYLGRKEKSWNKLKVMEWTEKHWNGRKFSFAKITTHDQSRTQPQFLNIKKNHDVLHFTWIRNSNNLREKETLDRVQPFGLISISCNWVILHNEIDQM